MRIVSLTCSNTEIVCALGCAEFLVGVDSDSDYPPEVVQPLPRVGRDLEIDADKVAALEPDLVLASLTVPGHEKVIERLASAGINFVAPEPVSLEDVYRDIRDIGGLLGVTEKAQQLTSDMRSKLLPHDEKARPSVLIQWWPKPVIAPGALSWADDLIRLAGGSNPLADREVKSAPLDDSEVADINPDAIVISWCGVSPDKYRPDVIYRNPAFSGVAAVKNRHVHTVPEAYLGRPGPRLAVGYQLLRQVVSSLA